MAGATWAIPSDFIARTHDSRMCFLFVFLFIKTFLAPLALPPPQFYELLRLRLVHCNERESLAKMGILFLKAG